MVMPKKINLRKIRAVLKSEDIKVKKRLGQNFLVDKQVVKKMVEAADLNREDVVLEVGPGLGILTEEIAKKAKRVLAVEKDAKLFSYLSQKFKTSENIKLFSEDIFGFDFKKSGLRNFSCKIVANIPFYITSRFLRYILEQKIRPRLLVLLIQKEVAERITAVPGQHSLLSLSVQFYGEPSLVADVSRKSFYPAPDVDSSILKIEIFEKPRLEVDDTAGLFRLIRIGFSSRRKQLHNNLAAGLRMSSEEAKRILFEGGIDPMRRAQSLSLEEWRKLYEIVRKEAKPPQEA
jgi:16S rRNA (adenine1518-N6/adenine1519-N6)-dimethyltransferase